MNSNTTMTFCFRFLVVQADYNLIIGMDRALIMVLLRGMFYAFRYLWCDDYFDSEDAEDYFYDHTE